MNNHLQLCRILLLQIHGKLKPISILSPSQRNLSRGCSCSPALLAVPCLAAPGLFHTPGNACPGLGYLSLPPEQVEGRLDAGLLSGLAEVGAEPGLISLEQHQRVRVGQGMQGGLNLHERGGCRFRVALGHQERKFVPFASAKAIKHTGRAIPKCLPAFRGVYTGAVAKVGGLLLPLADVGGCHSKNELSCKSVFLPLQGYFSLCSEQHQILLHHPLPPAFFLVLCQGLEIPGLQT